MINQGSIASASGATNGQAATLRFATHAMMGVLKRKVEGLMRRLAMAMLAGVLSALVGCGGVQVPQPSVSPTGPVDVQLRETISTILDGNELAGVAIRDLRTGNTWGLRADYASQSASMAKPMIVAMALRTARANGTSLSADQLEDCRKAITESDNDAADRLWDYAGRSGAYGLLASELGMKATHPDESRDWWSWTWTTPADQLILLEALLHPDGKAITADESSLILELMNQVRSDQAWGVGVARSEQVKVGLKNGWVKFESTDNLWAVNSIGIVESADRQYLLAVMTRYPEFEVGKETCSAIGRWVFDILGSGEI
jgi:hypothetical protein